MWLISLIYVAASVFCGVGLAIITYNYYPKTSWWVLCLTALYGALVGIGLGFVISHYKDWKKTELPIWFDGVMQPPFLKRRWVR